MSEKAIHECECVNCQGAEEHPDKALHHQMNVFLSRLDEQQRRWYVALEARKLGYGGISQMAAISGMSVDTIRRGLRELDQDLAERPVDRVRLPGGGRQPVEKSNRGSKGP